MSVDTYFKIQLEPYRGKGTRHMCPKCGHKSSFTRYIDVTTGEYIGDDVGRCNRIEKCGYHKPPSSADMGEDANLVVSSDMVKDEFKGKTEVDYIDPRNLLYYNNHTDNLSSFLFSLFPAITVETILSRYFVGRISRWKDAATIFWQIDQYNRIRTGKIMLYNEITGKRVKEPYNKITWAHVPEILEYEHMDLDFGLQQCFFGEHLLRHNPDTIHIVESEKTALLCSLMNPEVIWMATGGLEMINEDRLLPLKGRKLVFYPDKGEAYNKWVEKLKPFKKEYSIKVNKALERTNEVADGDDMGDLIIKRQKETKK